MKLRATRIVNSANWIWFDRIVLMAAEDKRAATVANYLRAQENIPMRRILVPAGYAAMHPAASNVDAQGRALNRRVDVKILVNKGLNAQM